MPAGAAAAVAAELPPHPFRATPHTIAAARAIAQVSAHESPAAAAPQPQLLEENNQQEAEPAAPAAAEAPPPEPTAEAEAVAEPRRRATYRAAGKRARASHVEAEGEAAAAAIPAAAGEVVVPAGRRRRASCLAVASAALPVRITRSRASLAILPQPEAPLPAAPAPLDAPLAPVAEEETEEDGRVPARQPRDSFDVEPPGAADVIEEVQQQQQQPEPEQPVKRGRGRARKQPQPHSQHEGGEQARTAEQQAAAGLPSTSEPAAASDAVRNTRRTRRSTLAADLAAPSAPAAAPTPDMETIPGPEAAAAEEPEIVLVVGEDDADVEEPPRKQGRRGSRAAATRAKPAAKVNPLLGTSCPCAPLRDCSSRSDRRPHHNAAAGACSHSAEQQTRHDPCPQRRGRGGCRRGAGSRQRAQRGGTSSCT